MSRPTLNWKGASSTGITGLIISTLPAITKPPIRATTVEIPGRDGSLVDEDGYGSYTKTVRIGLTPAADIDEVIKFFTGSGNLIMSNEPTRVYRAAIYDQIDYEALLRFKTADIEFLVQPFKYLAGETATTQAVTGGSPSEMDVFNYGLEDSRPLITIEGSGQVILTVGGNLVCELDIDDDEITIDSEAQDAYNDNGLLNNKMTGAFPILAPGENTIAWSGTGSVTSVSVLPRSRWL